MYMWSWCSRKFERTQSEMPPNSRRVLLQVTALHLSPLSFRCSHRRRFTLLFLHTRLSPQRSKVCKKPSFVKVCKVLCKAAAEFVQKRTFRTCGQSQTSTLATAITTRLDTDHNTYNNNYKACVSKWGCGEVSIPSTESSTWWLLLFMCC